MTNSFFRLATAALLCAGCALSSAAQAAEPVLLLTGDDYPPFTGSNLPGRGVATQIVEAAFADAGIAVTVRFVPWMRAEETVKQGGALAYPYIKTDAREKVFQYSTALFRDDAMIWVPEAAVWTYSDKSDLRGRTGCTPYGYALEPVIADAQREHLIKMESPESMESCFGMLKRGRVDFVVGGRTVTQWLFKSKGIGAGVRAQVQPVGENFLYLIISQNRKDASALLAAFDAAIGRMMRDGRIAALVDGYLK